MRQKLTKFNWVWPVLVLALIQVVVWGANVDGGTWLVGWDSTMPELNLAENWRVGIRDVVGRCGPSGFAKATPGQEEPGARSE